MANEPTAHANDAASSDLLFLPMGIRLDQGMGIPSDADMNAIRALAGEAIKKEDLFRFASVASTNGVDTYYTHMDEKSSLRNFKDDLTRGAALLDSHFVYRLPVGLSYAAIVADIADGVAEGVPATRAVTGAFYIPRKINVQAGQSTDDYIRGIETGVYRKMSIGFGGPEMRIVSDDDGTDLYDWESQFYPGMRKPDGSFATYTVFDARLYESSLVYKNATPGALVQRVQALITDRRVPAGEVQRLSGVFGARFDAPNFRVTFSDRTTQKGDQMDPKLLVEGIITRAGATLSAANKDKLRGAVTSLDEVSATIAGMIESADAVTTKAADAARVIEDVRKVAKFDPADAAALADAARLIEAGGAFRATLIAETLAARVAVVGQAIATEDSQKRFGARLATMAIDDVRDEHSTWTAQRSGAFVPGNPIRRTDPNAVPVGEDALVITERD